MNDFNLRPEIMGFGRPERVLAEQPAPVEPADQWKPHGKSFEVNGLGQLRTALALPASEAEIAASMRHADAAPMAHTDGCHCDGCTASSLGGRFSNPTKIMAEKPQGVNYTARYMAMTDAELDATRHVPQECDEDGEAFRRELRIRKL